MKKFTGRLAFLSNMHPCRVVLDNLVYKCAESAYQAAKTTDMNLRKRFTHLDGYEAKRLGKSVLLRQDWDQTKLVVMQEILFSKFTDNLELKAALLQTPDSDLEETNYWHDNFWGNCTCPKCVNIPGQNMLGKSLKWVKDLITRLDDD